MTEVIEAKEPAPKQGRPPKLHAVKLLKNSAPKDHVTGQEVRYEIKGYWTDEYTIPAQRPGDSPKVVPPEWVAGVPKPPKYAGVGTISPKILAGTVVGFEAPHANWLIKNGLATRADEFVDD